MTDCPTVIARAAIAAAGSGARFASATVTSPLCVAERPPGSVAVTVTVAEPAANASSVRSLPETLTESTAGALEAAS